MTKEAIAHIRKEKEQEDVDEFFLDNIKIEKISDELRAEIEETPELMCLSMNDCGLTSLANFPNCKALIRLEVMGNKFPARELQHLSHLTSLQSLSLGTNNIERFEDLEPLKKLPDLVQLDLSDCGLTAHANFRKQVFDAFPQLQILDNCDIEGNEYQYSSGDEQDEDEDEEGSFGVGDGEEEDEEDLEDEDDDEEDDGNEDDEDDDDDEEEEVLPAKRVKK